MATSAATPMRGGWAAAAAAAHSTGAGSEESDRGASPRARAQEQRMPVGLRPVTQQQLEARHLRRAASAPVNGGNKSGSAAAHGVASDQMRMHEMLPSDDDDGEDTDDGEWKSVESKSRWNRAQKRMVSAASTQRGTVAVAPTPRVQSSSYYSWATTSVTSASSTTTNSHGAKMPSALREDSSRRQQLRPDAPLTIASSSRFDQPAASSPHRSLIAAQDESRRNTSARGRKPEQQNGYQMKTNRSGVRSPPPVSDPDLYRSTSLQKLLDRIELEKQTDEPSQQQTATRRRNDQGSSSAADQERRSSIEPVKPPTAPAQKCGDKRDFFFRNLDFDTRNRLQIDDVAGFSVTEHEMATKISEAILALYAGDESVAQAPASDQESRERSSLTITDATACVGGNVISFCDYFAIVNAVECDLTRCEMLRHNLAVLKKDNAICIHASYLMVMHDLQQDVVFMDPPWGGPEYKDLAKVDLFLDDIPLYDICRMLHRRAKIVILKVPTNFDAQKFAERVPGKVTVRHDLNKMHLIAIDFREESSSQETSSSEVSPLQAVEAPAAE